MADGEQQQQHHTIRVEPVDPGALVAIPLEGGAWRIVVPSPVFELAAGDADTLGRLLLFDDQD